MVCFDSDKMKELDRLIEEGKKYSITKASVDPAYGKHEGFHAFSLKFFKHTEVIIYKKNASLFSF